MPMRIKLPPTLNNFEYLLSKWRNITSYEINVIGSIFISIPFPLLTLIFSIVTSHAIASSEWGFFGFFFLLVSFKSWL